MLKSGKYSLALVLQIAAACLLRGQNTWSLEISSNVELRTLKLTNKAEQDSKPLKGATILLYQGSTVVKQVLSDSRGDFSMIVPPDGDFMIVVSFAGCNQKKFQVSTKDVPETYDKDGWEPTFPIGGVIMAKPLYSISYEALKQPMARISFKQRAKVFDDDENYTDQVLSSLKQIKAAEDELIARFLEAVQTGDAALKKPDCPLAKAMYEKALTIIPGEEYPIAQLAKVGDCLVEKEKQDKLLAEQAEKAKQEAAAKQKLKDDRRAKELAQAEKFAKEKEEEKARRKEEEERLAKEKTEAEKKENEEKLAREKTKEETEALEKEKAAAEKLAKDQAESEAKQKEEAERLAAEKANGQSREKEKADKAAKEELARKVADEKRAIEEKERLAKKQADENPKQKAEAPPAEKKPPEKIVAKEQPKTKKKAELAAEPAISQGASEEGGGGVKVKSKRKARSVPHVIGTSQYQKLIAEADELYNSKEYTRALALYDKALDLKPADAYASSRIDEIKLLQSGRKAD